MSYIDSVSIVVGVICVFVIVCPRCALLMGRWVNRVGRRLGGVKVRFRRFKARPSDLWRLGFAFSRPCRKFDDDHVSKSLEFFDGFMSHVDCGPVHWHTTCYLYFGRRYVDMDVHVPVETKRR